MSGRSYVGRNVVVTGGTSGIGAALVDALIEAGASVTCIDIREPTAAVGQWIDADLADPTAVDAAAAAAVAFGDVHALFNCAGITGTNPRERVLAVNFRGVRQLSRALTECMPPGAAITSVASVGGAGWRANLAAVKDYLSIDDSRAAAEWCDGHPELFERGAYSFSKQCLIVWSKTECVALAAHGIRINTVSPGAVDTPMLRDSAAIGGQQAVDALPKPLGRVARPGEIVEALLFLNSDAASYITGHDLAVDAGLLGAAAVGAVDFAIGPVSR